MILPGGFIGFLKILSVVSSHKLAAKNLSDSNLRILIILQINFPIVINHSGRVTSLRSFDVPLISSNLLQ